MTTTQITTLEQVQAVLGNLEGLTFNRGGRAEFYGWIYCFITLENERRAGVRNRKAALPGSSLKRSRPKSTNFLSACRMRRVFACSA